MHAPRGREGEKEEEKDEPERKRDRKAGPHGLLLADQVTHEGPKSLKTYQIVHRRVDSAPRRAQAFLRQTLGLSQLRTHHLPIPRIPAPKPQT